MNASVKLMQFGRSRLARDVAAGLREEGSVVVVFKENVRNLTKTRPNDVLFIATRPGNLNNLKGLGVMVAQVSDGPELAVKDIDQVLNDPRVLSVVVRRGEVTPLKEASPEDIVFVASRATHLRLRMLRGEVS